MTPLARLKNLETLAIAHTEVRDLPPVLDLPKLRQLDIEHTWIADLAPLATFPNLELLCFEPYAKDLSPLAPLPKLEVLMVSDCVELPELARIKASLPRCAIKLKADH